MDALLAAGYEWKKSGTVLKGTSCTTEDARTTRDGRPVENEGGLNVCLPSGFPVDVELTPQSFADVERLLSKAE